MKPRKRRRRNRQSFDYVHSAADLNSVNGNHGDVVDAEQPVDPELLSMGDNPARAAFIILAQVARHLASIPGHKSLVWVSSDNVLADWEDQAVAIDKSPKMVESYGRRTQEAMNEAHTAVYPFDVSQLEAGGVGADLQNSSVQLTAAAQDNAATAAGAAGPGSTPAPSARQTGNGRINASMSRTSIPSRDRSATWPPVPAAAPSAAPAISPPSSRASSRTAVPPTSSASPPMARPTTSITPSPSS